MASWTSTAGSERKGYNCAAFTTGRIGQADRALALWDRALPVQHGWMGFNKTLGPWRLGASVELTPRRGGSVERYWQGNATAAPPAVPLLFGLSPV